jgi:hypothetical protein
MTGPNVTGCVKAIGTDRARPGQVNVKGTAIRTMWLELEQFIPPTHFARRRSRVVACIGVWPGITVLTERA